MLRGALPPVLRSWGWGGRPGPCGGARRTVARQPRWRRYRVDPYCVRCLHVAASECCYSRNLLAGRAALHGALGLGCGPWAASALCGLLHSPAPARAFRHECGVALPSSFAMLRVVDALCCPMPTLRCVSLSVWSPFPRRVALRCVLGFSCRLAASVLKCGKRKVWCVPRAGAPLAAPAPHRVCAHAGGRRRWWWWWRRVGLGACAGSWGVLSCDTGLLPACLLACLLACTGWTPTRSPTLAWPTPVRALAHRVWRTRGPRGGGMGSCHPRAWCVVFQPRVKQLLACRPSPLPAPSRVCRPEHPQADRRWLRDPQAHRDSLPVAREPP